MICSGVYDGRNFQVDFSTVRVLQKNEFICGIYGISGVNRNVSVETSLYLGSALDCYNRVSQGHINRLKRDDHYNPHFQRYVNKYGVNDLQNLVLEQCNSSNLLKKEQNWLDYYNFNFDCKALFNISKIANGVTHSKEGREKITRAACKEWVVITPFGEKIEVYNLNQFCKDRNLHRGTMTGVAMGRVSSNKGYKCFLKGFEALSDFKSKICKKDYLITFPNGETKKINGLYEFSKIYGLNLSSLHAVATGRLQHHKGFKCNFLNLDDYLYKKRELKEKILLNNNNNNEIVKFVSVTKFCKINNLNKSGVKALLSGRLKSYKGYTKLNE